LDFSTLSPEYASKKGIFAHENAGARAKEVRHWLRSRDEEIIVGTSPPYRCLLSSGNGRMADDQWWPTEIS
jgi:hypothetical protein